MAEHILVGIVTVIVLGISAQWLAWRFKVPSILLLLIFGFVAGPVTGHALLDPEQLQGQWLFSFVSLSIGIILFEGGLSLRVKELREVGKAVFNLITIGVLFTWALVGLSAYYLLGFNVGLSVLIGALLTVTGPTVVVPLLRQVRPTGRVGALAKWEGITIDPVGAILAVLVLETILLLHEQTTAATHDFGSALLHAAEGLLLTIFISVGISVLAAALLVLILRRRLVPDYLQSSFALMVVVGTFALSNTLQEESGLLEVTLLGILMANQRYVPVRRISEFKEDLQVLLIGSLFILLSARLQLTALDEIDASALLFLAVLILLVRPLAVMLSSLGTPLNWREQTFLAWLAPRGIVAAAVAALFAYRLGPEGVGIYPEEVIAPFLPVVFLVIVGTVAVYGLTIGPLARWMGLAEPNAQGVLILGAHPWSQQLAKALEQLEVKVLMIDSNARNIERARQEQLHAETANALSESVIDELDLSGIGRLLALTPNDEVNSLAALHFSEIFESNEVYQLAARPGSRQAKGNDELPRHLRGRPLFGESTSHLSLTERFNDGDEILTFELTEGKSWEDIQNAYQEEAVLLFVKRGEDLLVHSEEGQIVPQEGDHLVALVPPTTKEQGAREKTPFEHLVMQAAVIEMENTTAYEEVVHRAASVLADRLQITTQAAERGFIDSSRFNDLPVTHGAALPHFRLPGIDEPALVLVRCTEGTCIEYGDDGSGEPVQSDPVYAMLFLVSPEEHPGEHLRILANIASRLDEEQFLSEWRTAKNEQELKETLLREDRFLSLHLDEQGRSTAWIGRRVNELNLPRGNQVSLLGRNGHVEVPDPDTVLQAGDRLTIVGDSGGIRYLAQTYTRPADEPDDVPKEPERA